MAENKQYRLVELRGRHDGKLAYAQDDDAAVAAIAVQEIGTCTPGHDYAVVEDCGTVLRIVKRFTAKIVESSNG